MDKSGFLLIDKPKGISSHGVVNTVRRITGIKKVGHGGTLDPNATGLLIVGVGRESTKKLGTLLKETTKEYVGEIVLGETRDTDDIEGQVVFTNEYKPSEDEVKNAVLKFVGEIEQIPPAYSAIKMKGKKAYESARKGKFIKMEPRKITIYSVEVLKYKYPVLEIQCLVSSGTYIRALARDIGEELGTYAYLRNLRRMKIGEYDVKEAVELDRLTEHNWEQFRFSL